MPNTRATPVRLPMAASCPIVRNVERTTGFPFRRGRDVPCRSLGLAKRMLCRGRVWFPGAPIRNDCAIAQRPQPGQSGHRKVLVNDDSSAIELTRQIVNSGCGDVPAVHTTSGWGCGDRRPSDTPSDVDAGDLGVGHDFDAATLELLLGVSTERSRRTRAESLHRSGRAPCEFGWRVTRG